MKKVLYFGSFNPVHYGHTSIAQYIASMQDVDAVVIIPSPHNPFKDTSTLADPSIRLEQVRNAFHGLSGKISVSDIEYHLQEPLYTIRTLHLIRSYEPERELVLLIGADNVATIRNWYKGNDILAEFEVWVYPRRGYDGEKICNDISADMNVKGIRFLSGAPMFDISSTEIRASAKKA